MSTLMNGLVPGAAVFFTFSPLPIGAWGADGFAAFALRMIVIVGAGMTLIMTWVTRARARRGAIPFLSGQAQQPRWLRFVPASLAIRALAFAALALLTLGTLDLAIAWLARDLALQRLGFTVFVFSMGALLGLVLTRPILLAALHDSIRLRRA